MPIPSGQPRHGCGFGHEHVGPLAYVPLRLELVKAVRDHDGDAISFRVAERPDRMHRLQGMNRKDFTLPVIEKETYDAGPLA